MIAPETKRPMIRWQLRQLRRVYMVTTAQAPWITVNGSEPVPPEQTVPRNPDGSGPFTSFWNVGEIDPANVALWIAGGTLIDYGFETASVGCGHDVWVASGDLMGLYGMTLAHTPFEDLPRRGATIGG